MKVLQWDWSEGVALSGLRRENNCVQEDFLESGKAFPDHQETGVGSL
jgi:hypothetical protein